MPRVTLLTIAEALGVSRTTVSNAYSRPDQLSTELRDRIFEMAERLGYRGPNAAARTLRTGRVGALGLVFTEDLRFIFSDPSTSMFMAGVAAETSEANLALTLLPIPAGKAVTDTALPSTTVDGYLLFSVSDDHPVVTTLTESGTPMVVVDEPYLDADVSFVGVDDRGGATEIARHVCELGHRSVAVLAHRLDDSTQAGPVTPAQMSAASIRVTRERFAGYLAGLGDVNTALWSAGSMTVDGGRRATVELLAAHPDVTAILCMTDQLAIGATQAITQTGRRVPDDVSVAGFDDIPRAANWEPALTTMRQPLEDKGRIAARMLQSVLDGNAPERRQIGTELIIRDSTAPAPT